MMTITKILCLSMYAICGCGTTQQYHQSHSDVQTDHSVDLLKSDTQKNGGMKRSPKPIIPPQRIAILPLKNKSQQKIPIASINYLTDQTRILMTHLPHRLFSIMTQENFDVMLDPEEGGLEECIGTCEVEIGRMLNAHWMITGELIDIDHTLNITLKVHHTQSGQFMAGTSFQARNFNELSYLLKKNIIKFLPIIYPNFPEGRLELISRYLDSQKPHLISSTKRYQKQDASTALSCTDLDKKNLDHQSPCVSSSSSFPSPPKAHEPRLPPAIYFSNRQTKVLRKSFESLHQVFMLLKAKPQLRIQIRGHTDDRERKTRQQRVLLSKKRSEIVFNYLLLQGINAKRLEVKGLGSSEPLSSHQSLRARMRNRRVDFNIL